MGTRIRLAAFLVGLVPAAAGIAGAGVGGYNPGVPGGASPPPLFDPRSEPITQAATIMPGERADIGPRLAALRAARHELMLRDRHSDPARQQLQEQAYMAIATLNANSDDGALMMQAIGEVETTAGTLITLGDRNRARTLMGVVQTKIGQLLAAKPLNPVLRFLDRSVSLKLGLASSGQGGPMPPAEVDPSQGPTGGPSGDR